MAKRATGIEKMKTSRSKKTKKRLAIKREMLAKKTNKLVQKKVGFTQKANKKNS